jgi:hypothetical protein
MLSNAELIQNINVYQDQYNTAKNLRELLLPSKAALLDVCGWLEEAMDQVVIECANRCMLSTQRLQLIQKEYVGKTYGFEYQRHFEKMLAAVVGFRILEQAERQMGLGTLMPFTSALSSLVPLRNHYAHTHLDAAKPYPKNVSSIPAPSALVPYVSQANTALQSIESALRGLNC